MVNNKVGKPNIKLNKKIKLIICKKTRMKNFKVFLSLSDEKKYSMAFVILRGSK